MSVITVLGEEEIPPPVEVLERQEGYIGRKVRLRIDQDLWVRDGLTAFAGEFETIGEGWVLRAGTRSETSLGGARMRVGGVYVIPLTEFERGWGALTPRSVFAFPSSNIAVQDVKQRGMSAIAAMLSALPLTEVGPVLKAEEARVRPPARQ